MVKDKITTISVIVRVFNILVQHKAKVRTAKTNWSDYLLYILENSLVLDLDTIQRIQQLREDIKEERKIEEEEKLKS